MVSPTNPHTRLLMSLLPTVYAGAKADVATNNPNLLLTTPF